MQQKKFQTPCMQGSFSTGSLCRNRIMNSTSEGTISTCHWIKKTSKNHYIVDIILRRPSTSQRTMVEEVLNLQQSLVKLMVYNKLRVLQLLSNTCIYLTITFFPSTPCPGMPWVRIWVDNWRNGRQKFHASTSFGLKYTTSKKYTAYY